MQTNSKTHPFRALWMPKRGGYHANTLSQSFATEQEARQAAQPRHGYKVEVQFCTGRRYVTLPLRISDLIADDGGAKSLMGEL